jgi:hypothetical protein
MAALTDRGLVPPLDAHGRPDLTGVPLRDRTYLVENWLNVLSALSSDRILAAYDQATQEGITVRLDRLTARGRVTRTMVIHLNQVGATYEGHTDREPIVILNIDAGSSSVTESRSHTGSRGPSGSVGSRQGEGLDPSFGLDLDLDLNQGGLDLRRTVGATTSASVGSGIGEVTLFESNEPGAIFRMSHELRVDVLTDDGDPDPLLEGHLVEGILIVPVDMLPSSDQADATPTVGIGPPSEALFGGSMLVHVDTGGLWEAVRVVLPRAATPGTAAHAVLRQYVSGRRLRSNPEFLYAPIPIGYLVGTGPWPGSRSSLDLTVRPGPAEFLGVVRAIMGDINLTLHTLSVTNSVTEGRSRSVSPVGGYDSDTSDNQTMEVDSSLALSGGSNTTASTTTSSTAGRETLGIHTGLTYLMRVPYAVRLTGTEDGLFGPTTNRQEVPGLSAVLALPEDRALRLYARGEAPVSTEAIIDALQRYAESSLYLDRLTAIGVLARFLTERAHAGETVEAIDSDPDLTQLLADRLTKAFPDVTLPPGLPPPPMDRIRHIIQHRNRQIIEHGVDLPAVVGPLAEATVPDHMRGGKGPVHLEDIVIELWHDGVRHGGIRLLNAVLEHLEQVHPGILDAVPVLRIYLTNHLLGHRFRVTYPVMAAPRGLEIPVHVPPTLPRLRSRLVPGMNQTTQELTVRIRLEEQGVPVVTGENRDQGQITQNYDYEGETAAVALVVVVGGSLTSGVQPSHDGVVPTAGGGTGPGTQDIGSTATTRTDMQRLAEFDGVGRFRQQFRLVITTETRSTPYGVRRAARATAGLVRRRPTVTTSEPAEYDGNVTLVVPTRALQPVPTQATVAGPVALPPRYFVNQVDSDVLYDVIHAEVEDWGLLTGRSGAINRALLSRALSQLVDPARLPSFATGEGHVLVTLVDFGVPGRFAEVRLRVSLSDSTRNDAVNSNVELGRVGRLERVVNIVRAFTHSLTTSPTVVDPLAGSGVERGGSGTAAATVSGDRVAGMRAETSIFERGNVGGVAVNVAYDVTITRYHGEPGGSRVVVGEPSVLRATGTAGVGMFDHAIPGYQPAPQGTQLPGRDSGERVEGVIAAALAAPLADEQPVNHDPTEVVAAETPVPMDDRGYDLRGIDPMDIVPDDASVRVLRPDPNGGAQYGLEFKWINQNGQTVRLRVHGPDGTAPAGSNAASGDSYRVQIGARYQDIEGNLYHRNVHNPRSPNYDPAAADDSHIPWPSQYPGL